jgi:hypothetical protein
MTILFLPQITKRTTMIGQRIGLNVFSLDSSSLLHQLLHRFGECLSCEDEESPAAEIVVALGGGGAIEHRLFLCCDRRLLDAESGNR